MFVNEASPYAVFRVSAQGGQVFSLSLEDGPRDGALPTDRDAQLGVDYGQVGASGSEGWGLQVFNGLTWQPYVAGEQVPVPDGGTVLLVRVPIINDDIYKGEHTFFLKATYVSEGVEQTVRGEGVIGDFGTGATFNNSGATVSNPVLDDDRSLKVNSLKVNEGSPWAVFTISGIPGQEMQFNVVQGADAGSASLGASPSLQVWKGTAWQDYNPATPIIVPESATVLVRVSIGAEQDTDREGTETFDLRVVGELNGLVLSSEGRATIYDDGTGVIYPDADPEMRSGKPGPMIATGNLDDDFDKDGIAPNIEEALATLSASQGKGAVGDLNDDGTPDAEQSALATLAWITRDDFAAGLGGNLARVQPIVSVMVVSGDDGTNVDATAQLASIEVVAYETAAGGGVPVPRAGDLGASDLVVTWDPIRFAVEAGIGSDGVPVDFSTLDIDLSRGGVQVRIYIDVENTGLRDGDLNAYLKYISQEVIDAAGTEPLRDLEGLAILEPGWFDFTRKQNADGNYVGDGARFVIRDGRIVGIELIITDNAFGDNDPSAGRIFDPGVPARLERAAVAELPAGAAWPLEPIQRKTGLELIPLGRPPAYVTYITEASRLGIAEGFATTTTYWSDPLDPPWTAEELLEKGADVFGQPDLAPAAEAPELDVGMATISFKADAGEETIIEALDRLFDDVVSESGRVYEARMVDGTPLPDWISVDPATGGITVDAPDGYAGVVEIRVTVRDAAGREGVVTVEVEIDQQQSELSDAARRGMPLTSEDWPVDDGFAEMLRVVHALSEPKVTGIGAQASGFSAALAATSVPPGLLQFPAE